MLIVEAERKIIELTKVKGKFKIWYINACKAEIFLSADSIKS